MYTAQYTNGIIEDPTPDTDDDRPSADYASVLFKKGAHGNLEGATKYYVLKAANKKVSDIKKPEIKAEAGWHVGATKWLDAANAALDNDTVVNADIVYTAQYEEMEPTDYYFDFGANSEWNNSDENLKFVVKAKVNDNLTFDHFSGVDVDGTTVDPANYEATRGSVRLSMLSSYLKKLSVGSHTLTVHFDNGTATTNFVVKSTSSVGGSANSSVSGSKPAGIATGPKTNIVKKNNHRLSPRTGDASDILVQFAILLTAILGLLVALIWQRKGTARR